MKKTLRLDLPTFAILAIALVLRVLLLAMKPPHFDEGINGWWVDQLIAKGFYPYDPTNYHGPLHFYLLLLFKIFFGRNLWALRLPSVIFGLASVYLVTRLEEYVGRFTALSAALIVAVSPGMVFYSRYAIHEPELLFFSLLTLLGFLRYMTQKDLPAVWLLSLGCAGMIVTKETFFIHLLCFGIAYLCLVCFEAVMNLPKPDFVERQFLVRQALWPILISVLIVYVFYSGFFINNAGIIDLFRSFGAWAKTGQAGNGHQKSFWYWSLLFMRYEWVSFVGLVLSIKLILPTPRWLRLIGIYGVGIFLAYSLIPYKTPWCILELIWPFVLVGTNILEDFSQHGARPRGLALTALMMLALTSTVQTISLNFFHYTDDQEPYVYVQTFDGIMPIVSMLKTVASEDAVNYHIPIKIYLESNWPLPWMLGEFTHVSYYSTAPTGDVDADLVLVDVSHQKEAEINFKQNYFTAKLRLRSAQGETIAYFAKAKFSRFFNEASQHFEPVAVKK